MALDLGATCFLPPSFFVFAMAAGEDSFIRLVTQYVDYPAWANLKAMMDASYYLVPFGTNNIVLLYSGLLCMFTISNVQPDKCTLAYSIYVELTSALPPLHGLLDFN
ncbi:hypothetical protein V8E53_000637 [Lactarius tabidus]